MSAYNIGLILGEVLSPFSAMQLRYHFRKVRVSGHALAGVVF